MFQELRASLTILLIFTLITGIVYPLLMMSAGHFLFPYQMRGSLVIQGGKIIGSELIGQNFTDNKYFRPRPSAAGNGYDASNSSGSNLAPSSPDLLKTIKQRVAELKAADNSDPIPIDLVTASGSGIDPDISVASAEFQAVRVAQARNITVLQVQDIIDKNITPRTFDILGENRVNVLAINRALDAQTATSP